MLKYEFDRDDMVAQVLFIAVVGLYYTVGLSMIQLGLSVQTVLKEIDTEQARCRKMTSFYVVYGIVLVMVAMTILMSFFAEEETLWWTMTYIGLLVVVFNAGSLLFLRNQLSKFGEEHLYRTIWSINKQNILFLIVLVIACMTSFPTMLGVFDTFWFNQVHVFIMFNVYLIPILYVLRVHNVSFEEAARLKLRPTSTTRLQVSQRTSFEMVDEEQDFAANASSNLDRKQLLGESQVTVSEGNQLIDTNTEPEDSELGQNLSGVDVDSLGHQDAVHLPAHQFLQTRQLSMSKPSGVEDTIFGFQLVLASERHASVAFQSNGTSSNPTLSE